MNINLTLIVQMVFFFAFIWLCKHYVWPPLITAMDERQRKILEGLREAERARKSLELAKDNSEQTIREAKQEAAQLIEQANNRASKIIEDAKGAARVEGEKIVILAKQEADREVVETREKLRHQLGGLVGAGVQQVLGRTVDLAAHNDIVEQLAAEL